MNSLSHIAHSENRSAQKMNYIAVLFLLAIFYPLGIEIGGMLLWIELLAPLLFGLLVIANILNSRPMLLSGNRIYYYVILVLIIWAFVSWIRYPIYGSVNDVSSTGEVGIKSYYRILVGITVFFSSIWFAAYYLRNEFHIYLKILLFFSLFIGILRLLGFFLGFDIPFMYGVFRYNLEAVSNFGGVTLRLSGLDIAGSCGTFSLLALRQTKHSLKTHWFVLLLIIFTLFVFLHAGRTSAFCYLLGLFYYAVFIEGIDFKKALSGFALIILLVISLQFLPNEIFTGQLNRITAIQGGVRGQYSDRRAYLYEEFFEEFLDHPLFGRGMRPVSIGRANRNSEWIEQMLSDGGHGSYYSMLGLFGLGGVFFFAIFLFLSLWKIHFILARRAGPNRVIYAFIMLCLVYKILFYYTSGRGYNDYSLYLLAGMFVGLQAKKYGVIRKLN